MTKRPASYWTIGQWCAAGAVALYLGAESGLWDWLRTVPGSRFWMMTYVLLMLGLTVRAGHDALMYLFEAAQALREKREAEALGKNAADQWAAAKQIKAVDEILQNHFREKLK